MYTGLHVVHIIYTRMMCHLQWPPVSIIIVFSVDGLGCACCDPIQLKAVTWMRWKHTVQPGLESAKALQSYESLIFEFEKGEINIPYDI